MPSESLGTENPISPHAYAWIAGGGEMGQLIRNFDWSRTQLGPIESWPQSLRSAVSILLPSKAQIVMFWGPDLIALYNDAYRPVLGKKHPSALGLPGRQVWSEVWEEGLRELFEGVLKTGDAYWASDRTFYLQRFGFPEETFFDISYDPIRDESGAVAGLFCIVSDTTARVLSDRRLKTLRDLSLFAAAETKSVEDACRTASEILSGNQHDIPFSLIYLLDQSGKNATLIGSSGLEPGTPAAPTTVSMAHATDPGWPFQAVLHTNSAAEIMDLSERYGELPGGVWPEPSHTARVMPIGGSGQDRVTGFLVAGVSPRRPLDDQYRAFFDLLTTQISTTVANARAYESERRRAEALAELDRAKTTFFSNVSHEFRTPLTLMLGPVADTLAEMDQSDASAQRERLEIAHRNGLRLQKLVNTLLEFSRIEAGRIQASYQPADLSSFTAELASNFRSACDRAGIDLVVECPALSEPVYVDADMWEKIVLNLISNAFKFTFTGRIEIRLRELGDQVQLSVKDTGVGIPAEELPKVFERFHRVEVARGRTQEGSGIGLALVRELVKLHGGSVKVESIVDEGSLFTVTLPKGSAHLPPDRVNAGRTLTSTAFGAETFVSEALRWLPGSTDVATDNVKTATARPLILLADDNADMRDYVSRLLSDRYQVVAVGDGQAALDVVADRLPTLVLSDVMMPVLDGFEFLRQIRANEQTRGIPVILLSARAGEESRIEALEASADDYLVKPFSARELLATVDTHIKTVELRRQAELAISKHNKRLAVLWEAAGVLLTTEDPDSMLSGLFEKIRESLSLDVYFNFMVNESGDALKLASCAGVDQETAESISTLDFGQAVCGNVALLRQPIVATHIQLSSEPMVQLVKGLGIHAYACNPLIAGNRFAGTLSFASRTRDTFDQEEIEFLETISHYVTLAYERLHLIEQLREQDRRKDEFLATLAHELRNPLAPIRNGLELIRLAAGDPAKLEQATAIMQRQIEQMVRLVDDLLDVARISRNKLELRKETVDLESIVRSAVDTSRPVVEASRNELHISLPQEPVLLTADPVRLAQVISNLLNNAARYSAPGGRISLTAKTSGDELIIKVSDTGIGIEPEKLAQIFDMFVQLDSSQRQGQGGLGVGLTLVRRMIEMHDGTVEARSEGRGKGSEFIARLPIVARKTEEAAVAQPKTAEIVTELRRRVLVVDDNVDSAESMAMMIELSGHDVAMAHDGAQAIELAKAFQPDVAFLDLGMPKVDGYEAARSIREQPWGRQILLVALTGWGQEDDKRRTREAGFDAHVVKPIEFSALEKLLTLNISE